MSGEIVLGNAKMRETGNRFYINKKERMRGCSPSISPYIPRELLSKNDLEELMEYYVFCDNSHDRNADKYSLFGFPEGKGFKLLQKIITKSKGKIPHITITGCTEICELNGQYDNWGYEEDGGFAFLITGKSVFYFDTNQWLEMLIANPESTKFQQFKYKEER